MGIPPIKSLKDSMPIPKPRGLSSSSSEPNESPEKIQHCRALIAKEVTVSLGRGRYAKKTVFVPDSSLGSSDDNMMIDQTPKPKTPEAEPQKKPENFKLNLSKLRLDQDPNVSVISNSNLSDTNEVQEYPENADRPAEKAFEEMDTSKCEHFGEIPHNVMALLDDSNQSIPPAEMTGPSTSTPARSSSSSLSSNSSMPPLESVSSQFTQDSGHSSAGEASDNAFVFANQDTVTENFEKDLLIVIEFINDFVVNRMPDAPSSSQGGQTPRSPGKMRCSDIDFITKYLFSYSYSLIIALLPTLLTTSPNLPIIPGLLCPMFTLSS